MSRTKCSPPPSTSYDALPSRPILECGAEGRSGGPGAALTPSSPVLPPPFLIQSAEQRADLEDPVRREQRRLDKLINSLCTMRVVSLGWRA